MRKDRGHEATVISRACLCVRAREFGGVRVTEALSVVDAERIRPAHMYENWEGLPRQLMYAGQSQQDRI